jgi:hypothetical protein
MTAQFTERLVYDGKAVAMCTEPLAAYFAGGGANPGFVRWSSACWRGYVGSWAIMDGQLYLTELEGVLSNGEKATLNSVFPAAMGAVLADWYSGVLKIRKGELQRHVHGGYASVHEGDLYLRIRKGIFLGEGLPDNQRILRRGGGVRATQSEDSDRRAAHWATLTVERDRLTGWRGAVEKLVKLLGLQR